MLKKFSSKQVEMINAHGPFNHSVWKNDDVMITNEERLSGRGRYLVNLISNTITSKFTLDEIREMSIADVGCYDGWILHELSHLPFKRMVGIEPRQKNIDKGIFVRNILKLSNQVEFRCGDLNTLVEEKFDIVLCLGLIHHLESLSEGLEILRKGTKGLVFIETICLSSKYFNKSLKQEVEMKDIVYKYKENTYGVSAQKYESAYYDGSANCLSVVNIPSVESILMTLSLKFRNVNVEADSETYRKAFINYDRYFNAVCISAESKNIEEENEINWVEDYEKKMIMTVLKERDIERVYNKFCKNRISDTSVSGRGIVLLFSGYLSSSVLLSKVCQIIINSRYKDTIERDIIKNIKYNPVDKLALEFGKVLFYSKEYNKAITVLKGITEKINSDWRCVYRSFLLLYQIYSVLNKEEDAKRYKNMFLKANPNASVLINN